MRLCNKLKKHANGDTGGDNAVIELVSVRRPFCFNHVLILTSEKMRLFASVFLSFLCLPDSVKDSIIDEMFRFARSMLNDDENAGLEVLPFVVDVALGTGSSYFVLFSSKLSFVLENMMDHLLLFCFG
ncbi:hypothetical protein RHGRI_026682 [Rhododendron griersonianum]|uniref:Uncharacterized protein n=1 Tax=Rhododendron griersonianum TaxID=479676 RepID=A0AAV6IYN7_9ERIC|nr:hypothetical protein RHGRI_026682 [Rhododendron griersonianum]